MSTPTPPTCPRCAAPRLPGDTCPRCGVIYARFRPRPRRPARAAPTWPRWVLLAGVLGIGIGIGVALRDTPVSASKEEPEAEPAASAPVAATAGPAHDTAAPALPLLDQEPVEAAHVSAAGVASLTLPPTHVDISQDRDGLRIHASARHPVRTVRLVIRLEGVPSRTRMAALATEVLQELEGELGPTGTVRRGLKDGLDAPFTGTLLGAPVQGRVQVLPLGPDTTAVLYGWGAGPAATHNNDLQAIFNSLAWAPNLSREATPPPACAPPPPGTRPLPVNAAAIGQRVENLRGCVTVLELWATDCLVCREPHTEAQGHAHALTEEGLAMVQVALDPSSAALERHLGRNRLASPALWLEPDSHDQLPASLARLGVDWPGTRPWFAVFDRAGVVAYQGAEPPPEAVLRGRL